MPGSKHQKHFTVSLDAPEYVALGALERSATPSLNLRYMASLAARSLLEYHQLNQYRLPLERSR